MGQEVNKRPSSKQQTQHSRKWRVVIIVIGIIFFVAGVTYAIFGESSSTNTLAKKFLMKEKINILVLGVDARDDDVGRSDTTFVVTIDTVEKKIAVLSIPRDSRVKIEGHGWDKINHAYAFGGSKLSKSTVEHLLSIPIDYTVVMNFQGFVRMIDALGGVTIDVDKRMYYSDPYDDDGGLYIDLHPGIQKLDGKTAIQYVRYRDEEGDIGRVTRQQKFLKALLQEFSKPQIITKLPDLIKEFAATVRTDMPTKEMVQLIPIIHDAAQAGLHTEWLSGTPCFIQDVSYWLPDIKELRYKVAQIQGITIDGSYTQRTNQLVNEYANSMPREIKVAEAPPTIKNFSNLDKQTADNRKTIPTSSKIAAIPPATKPKAESSSTNGKSISDSQSTKNTNSQSSELPGTSTEVLHNNTVTNTNGK